MGNRRRDITGEKFNMLTVISQTGEKHPVKGLYYICLCDCGANVVTHYASIIQGQRKSCGCLWEGIRKAHYEDYRINGRTHGLSGHPLYGTHKMMISRCTNPKANDYHRYGALGITVCNEWSLPNPEGFNNFVKDMGERPTSSHSIDRIDNDQGYSKSNCRWSTKVIQVVNRKRSTQPGITKTKNGERYQATISHNRKCIRLGTFETYEDAVSARRSAEMKYYGIYSIQED